MWSTQWIHRDLQCSVHTGEVLAGNIGSPTRMKCAATRWALDGWEMDGLDGLDVEGIRFKKGGHRWKHVENMGEIDGIYGILMGFHRDFHGI